MINFIKTTTLIIGGGPAGLTCLLYTLRAKIDVICVYEKIGGQIADSENVDNYPGFHEINGHELGIKIFEQIKNYNPQTIFSRVVKIYKKEDFFYSVLLNKETIISKTVILCSGARNKFLNLENENTLYAKSIFTCASCELHRIKDSVCIVAGGGNKGVEDAILISKFAKKVILIHKNNALKAEKYLSNILLSKKNVKVILNSHITHLCLEKKSLEGLEFIKTNQGEVVYCNYLFLAIGTKPNSEIVKNMADLGVSGVVLTKNYMSINCKGLFAGGEVRDEKYRQMITSCGEGCACALENIEYLNKMEAVGIEPTTF